MSEAIVVATHAVVRPGISVGGGATLQPGDEIDTRGWRADLVHQWERRGHIRRLDGPRVMAAPAIPPAIDVAAIADAGTESEQDDDAGELEQDVSVEPAAPERRNHRR